MRKECRSCSGKELEIFSVGAITINEVVTALLAVPAFIPATLCTGYLAAWFTNLHGFRQRSLVERFIWSLPLSIAISTITAVLIGRFISLSAVVAFFLISAAFWSATLGKEWLGLRRTSRHWTSGWRPLGPTTVILAVVWTVASILWLVDFQVGHQLYMSLTIFDHAPRVNWTESVLRTGIPPANPLYWYKHAASMRYYYFWYVICAAIAKVTRLPVRAIFTASCVWAGFLLAAIIALYLKHFLLTGVRLRSQFLRAIGLLAVSGLGICVNVWKLFHMQDPYIEVWPAGQITSWSDTILYDPHHIASLVCCMLAFLLAWMAGKKGTPARLVTVILIALALASAFGLSIYVAFTFFFVTVIWGVWQVAIERTSGPAMLLATGGVCGAILLLPYLRELTHGSSNVQGGSVFAFAVRDMIPPDGLLASTFFQHLAIAHPLAALKTAKLILLIPGYAIELGFYLAVLLVYLVPAWHGRIALTAAQRTFVFLAAVTLPLMSFVRSGVLVTNDFGWRASLFLQFPLLLLGSEVITVWSLAERKSTSPAELIGLPQKTPQWLRSAAALALVFGVITTVFQATLLRFELPLAQRNLRALHDPEAGKIPHNAFISSEGYTELQRVIPQSAIVQFNPMHSDFYWTAADLLGINRQTAILGDKLGCGSELGGDPTGCPAMAAAIDSLFNGASSEQARATCRQFGIQYLVTRIYDPAWKDLNSWVWTLRPVVADEEFRALECQ